MSSYRIQAAKGLVKIILAAGLAYGTFHYADDIATFYKTTIHDEHIRKGVAGGSIGAGLLITGGLVGYGLKDLAGDEYEQDRPEDWH